MNKRKLKLDDFGISKKRYRELCLFCQQYPEWKQKLRDNTFIQGVKYGDEPKPSNHENSDTTSKHALLMLKMKKDCEMIEKCAKVAFDEEWECIIKAACYEVPTNYLISWEGITMERSSFYEKRRYFFYLLDLEKKNEYCRSLEIEQKLEKYINEREKKKEEQECPKMS